MEEDESTLFMEPASSCPGFYQPCVRYELLQLWYIFIPGSSQFKVSEIQKMAMFVFHMWKITNVFGIGTLFWAKGGSLCT